MIIPTKYNVGDTFYVPRVYRQYEQQELVWEGETWYKDVETYVPLVKLKKIVCIEIRVGRSTGIMYGVKNIDEDDNVLTQHYPEANINNYTEEEAMSIAMEYAKQEKEYFGN